MSRQGQTIVVDCADRTWLARHGLASVDKVLKYKPETVAAISSSSDTFPVDIGSGDGGPQRIFIKRYRYRSWSVRMKGFFRGTFFGKSRARFEYEFLAEMRRRNVPAVRPIAYGEKRSSGFLKACFLITEAQTDAPSLDVMSTRSMEGDLHKRRERVSFVEALARVIRNMHRAGVVHGGLFWRNILVTRIDGGTWEFHLIDPDRAGRCGNGTVSRAGVVSDLADFVASGWRAGRRADLVRFLRAYLQVSRLAPSDKAIARDVIREARGRAAREVHRLAVGEMIDRLRRRIELVNDADSESPRRYESVEEVFAALARSHTNVSSSRTVTGKAHFALSSRADEKAKQYTVKITSDDVQVTPGCTGKADVTIQTDPETWLAIVNARPEAFELLRRGRIRIEGDTKLLSTIAELIDDK